MINFETIIGIEIHIELKTKTKMFSSMGIDYNAEPNTKASQVDMGYPGTLPILNKQAVKFAIMLAKALNMKIDNELHFDRKHYFYPDLPKGFQITQFYRPIGSDGIVNIKTSNGDKKIKVERIHLEEDTARQHHNESETELDYNRAGIPLIEIVTYPVIRSAEEAANYVDMIKRIVQTLEISDGKLEIGSLRADINVSIRPLGSKEFGTKVEIKNLNSLRNIKLSIEQEVMLQKEKYFKNIPVLQQTKRIDENGKLVVMRTKTGATDYKYFPEPNIPFIKLSKELIESIKIPELPNQREERYKANNIQDIYIQSLLDDNELAKYFDSIEYTDKEKLSKIFFAEVVSLANSKETKAYLLNIDPNYIKLSLELLDNEIISGKSLKKLITLLPDFKGDIKKLIEDNKLKQISDPQLISNIINDIILNNEKMIEEFPTRPEKVLKFILGNVMKQTGGQVNPNVANDILNDILNEKFNK